MSKYEFVGGLENQQTVAGNQRQTPWQDTAAHRQIVTQMLIEIARASNRPTLSVWGAGKCNDIELKPLLAHYSDIYLVDLDAELDRVEVVERLVDLGVLLRAVGLVPRPGKGRSGQQEHE